MYQIQLIKIILKKTQQRNESLKAIALIKPLASSRINVIMNVSSIRKRYIAADPTIATLVVLINYVGSTKRTFQKRYYISAETL